MCLRLGGLSMEDFRRVLMKTGLVLVVLGHVSFIAATLLHGTVLRYVAGPHDAVALQYCVVNILSVTSAIVGRALLATCTFGSPEVLVLVPDCPFDPTRIYSSSLCLWGISLVFCVTESVFAVRCAQLTHQLLELRPWWGKSSHHVMQESPEPVEGHDLLSCTSSEPLTL
ncbi:transmembrane protein 54 isoform X5 [Neomonachus schauinslandi]|uniref:Transmembrane protein 54 isoform X5 n=1 Tax=Neomonachus schauinslandi TaxID=29088 RepID=A0A8M1M7Y3_NEOSC|nr:transmembrane protein 54 isoform X5 [Neomonachus schauinslandi]